MVADELASMIDDDELARIERDAVANRSEEEKANNRPSQQDLLAELSHTDWERRLKAIQKIEVNAETFPAVVTALDDERSAIQRSRCCHPGHQRHARSFRATLPRCPLRQIGNRAPNCR